MKDIRCFDLHHQVLEAWEECRVKNGIAPAVLSLDFHTDVLNCARRGVVFPENAAQAVEVLHHDEHFDWALRADIISQAVIIALSSCSVMPEHTRLEVRNSDLVPDMDTMLNEPEIFRSTAEKVLSDSFLIPLLADDFPPQPYILDIDCDYLLCAKALDIEKNSFIDRLAANAQLITLCRENDWVKILKLPNENISGDMLCSALVSRWCDLA
jgi:hypothetical protein